MRNFFSNIFQFLIRATSFVSKELVEVLRQTPLILTLVLGPFLIMLLFGVGYRNEARPVRALIVMQPNDPLQQQVQQQATSMGDSFIFKGITSDQQGALQQLRDGSVDLVITVPPNAPETIRNNQQVPIQFFHNEIDPYQVSYIEYLANAYIDQVNRNVVLGYAVQGQESASTLQQRLSGAQQQVATMRQALQAGNIVAAQGAQQQLNGQIDAIGLLVGGSIGLASSLNGPNTNGNTNQAAGQDQALRDALTQLQQHSQQIGQIQPGQSSYQSQLQQLDQLDSDITNLQGQLKDFQSADPNVLVAPFKSEPVDLQGTALQPIDFFAPAVVVLLLQHLAITLAALAIVREQRSGSMELFRISPLSSLEMLIGKYLSYLIFGAFLAVIITATMVLALKVPMRGSWTEYGIIAMTLLFTALGVGFLLSLIARTEMQAVQYAMFLLLGSVFFTGFFLDLRYLWTPVHVVSWMIPATYAIQLMQSLMLRGGQVSMFLYAALLAIGVMLFILAWFFLRRRLQREWS